MISALVAKKLDFLLFVGVGGAKNMKTPILYFFFFFYLLIVLLLEAFMEASPACIHRRQPTEKGKMLSGVLYDRKHAGITVDSYSDVFEWDL